MSDVHCCCQMPDKGHVTRLEEQLLLADKMCQFLKDIRPFFGYDPEATLHLRVDKLIKDYEESRAPAGEVCE